MSLLKMDKKSIAFKLTSFTIILIIAQAVMLTAFLILGGVISQGRKNAYVSFSDKVKNRNEYIQREMKNQWTNMDPYIDQISSRLSEYEDSDQLFDSISNNLIAMMRTTKSTGVFVILGTDNKNAENPSLYIRDYDPGLNDSGNKDLYMVFGPSALANKLKIPLDQTWKNKISLNKIDASFYEKPYSIASLSHRWNLLGYWSQPFKLFPEDISIITYTMPLFDRNNQVKGVIGVEIATQYFSQNLPASDLEAKDSLGYFIGYKGSEDENIQPILLTKAIQKRLLNSDSILSYTTVDSKNNIYLLKNAGIKNDIYISIEKMSLYNDNTPFHKDSWYLIGMMTGSHLLSYVNNIQHILWISLLFSVIIGMVGGYLMSYQFTKPIIKLAKKVKEAHKDKMIILEETGLTEVDELSKAMQVASNSLLESTIKMSRIIDLVGLPIGAFEYRNDNKSVFITDQLQLILSMEQEEMTRIVQDKELFIEKINLLLNHPDEEEENVYILTENSIRWIKMKKVESENFTIGVIMDVTDEMMDKKKIIKERDYDSLTGIYNRKAMQRRIEEKMIARDTKLVSALLMFDLDNLKIMNDTYGHKWGDEYIKCTVRHLENLSENQMILGRRSGDEFTLFLYDFKTKDDIRKCIDHFYLKLSKDFLHLPDGKEKPIAISSGLVWVENNELTYDEYLQYADDALYKAKKNRKGTCCENEL